MLVSPYNSLIRFTTHHSSHCIHFPARKRYARCRRRWKTEPETTRSIFTESDPPLRELHSTLDTFVTAVHTSYTSRPFSSPHIFPLTSLLPLSPGKMGFPAFPDLHEPYICIACLLVPSHKFRCRNDWPIGVGSCILSRAHAFDVQVRSSGLGVEEFRIESPLSPPRWLLIPSLIDHDGFSRGSGYGAVLCSSQMLKIRLVLRFRFGDSPHF